MSTEIPVFTTRTIERESLVQADEARYIGDGLGLAFSERKVKFTKEFAEKMLQLPSLPYERKLLDNHVAYLLNAMLRGTFRPELCQIATCTLDRVEYRTNGQHTCWARSYLDAEYEPEIRWLRYQAETSEQIRDLYSSMDRAAPRTKSHVVTSRLLGTEEFAGVSNRIIQRLSEGIGLWLWERTAERNRHDADDRAQRLKTDHNAVAVEIAKFLGSVTGKESLHLMRSPVIAAMFATFEKSVTKSAAFWSVVRDGVGISEKHDPRHTLRNALLSSAVGNGGGARSSRKNVDTEEMFRWCILAWNAWRRGDELRVLRPSMSTARPKVRQ